MTDEGKGQSMDEGRWALDPLFRALVPYEGNVVVVEFSGYRARVRVHSPTEPDETESGFGDWWADVRKVLEDSPGNPYHGREFLVLSLDPNEDTPLRVTTLEGAIIWQQEGDSPGCDGSDNTRPR